MMIMTKKHFLVVELRNPAQIASLRSQISSLSAQAAALQRQLDTLERRFGYEVQLNAELIDILNDNNIPYRERLNFKMYPF